MTPDHLNAIKNALLAASARSGDSVAVEVAELLKELLMSDDAEPAHVSWLELHAEMEKRLCL